MSTFIPLSILGFVRHFPAAILFVCVVDYISCSFRAFLTRFIEYTVSKMGCDGGTIPKRDEMVRLKKKPEKVDKNFELNAKWFHCAITQEPLRAPIVSCELGNLYNKESLLEFLLDKESATTEVAKHIRSLRDTKELQLTENPAFEEKSNGEKADSYQDFQACRYVCPVVGIEMNGRYKFCFLWKCGCVFSERALKEVKSAVCHKCAKPFSNEDVVVINGSEEDLELMKSNMTERRQKAKLEKKSKKNKTSSTVTSTVTTNGLPLSEPSTISSDTQASKSQSNESDAVPSKKLKVDSRPQMNGAASSKTGKGKQPKINMNIPKLSNYNTVAEDPKASKVYKSLFSSSNKDRPDHLKSNWVAYHAYGGYHV